MATAVETIKTFMSALTKYAQDSTQVGRIALDDAVRQSTMYSSLEEAVDDLKSKLSDTETYPDTDTRLREATGMVLGALRDYSVDTGAITGANAGGSVVKDAQSIVPEDGDLSTATLPTPGSTTPITYTGEDGTSHTFYVKWPDSFSTIINGFIESDDELIVKIKDSRYHVDLNTLDPNGYYEVDAGGNGVTLPSPTYGQMKDAIQTILKGMNTYWLREAAKLDYDSLGMGLDGQTIEIAFAAGGRFEYAFASTVETRDDKLPEDYICLTISLSIYGRLDPTDPNGKDNYNFTPTLYLDRTIAHEMVHAIMLSNGTLKHNMPQFFTEGIADLVQGDDDDNANQYRTIVTLVNDSDTLVNALNYTPGTGSQYAYPAGYMFMRFLAKQNLNTTAIIGDINQAQTFDYNGNNEVITNYVEADKINYNASFKDADVSKTLNDFVVTTNEDNVLIVRDVRGKMVTFNVAGTNAYAYMADNAGEVNGRNINGGNNYEVLFGANYENNVIRAGNAGSYLWGGKLGNDELFGGAGQDTFVYAFDGGNDTVHNAESQDSVLISDMSLAQITSAQILDNGVSLQFTDGGTLSVEGQPTNFTLAKDNQVFNYRADYQNKTWVQV